MADHIARTLVFTKGRGTDALVVARYWVISSEGRSLCVASAVGLDETCAPNRIPAAIGASIEEAFTRAVAQLDKLHPAPSWSKEMAVRGT